MAVSGYKSNYRVIPCHIIQAMAPTNTDLDEIRYSYRTFHADSRNVNYFEISEVVFKLSALMYRKKWPISRHFEWYM